MQNGIWLFLTLPWILAFSQPFPALNLTGDPTVSSTQFYLLYSHIHIGHNELPLQVILSTDLAVKDYLATASHGC
jgi:hypothetical protein